MKAIVPWRRLVSGRWSGGVRLGVLAICAVGLSLLGAHQAATTAHPDPTRPVPAAAGAPGGAQSGGGAAASALP